MRRRAGAGVSYPLPFSGSSNLSSVTRSGSTVVGSDGSGRMRIGPLPSAPRLADDRDEKTVEVQSGHARSTELSQQETADNRADDSDGSIIFGCRSAARCGSAL